MVSHDTAAGGSAAPPAQEGAANGTTAARPLPVVVVSSDRAFIARLREELAGSPDLSLHVGHAPDVPTPIAQMANGSKAAVVVADASLVENGQIDPTPNVEHGPEMVLVFDKIRMPSFATMLRSRARGCIETGIAAAAFRRAVHSVAEGELWLPRWMLEMVYEHALAEGRSAPPPPAHDASTLELTAREKQVLRLVRRGLTNKEVGRHIGISPSTVKKHLHNALAKRGLFRRRQLVDRP